MNPSEIHTDQELIERFRNGDEVSYRLIYDRYWQLLFRFSRKLLQDDGLSKDVVQEVFTVLWSNRGAFGSAVPLAAYLYTLTRNRILNMIKHSKVEAKYLEHLQGEMSRAELLPDQLYIEKEFYDEVEREIGKLPERMRLVFEMSRKQYKSTSEIASELGLSEQTVKNQVSSAIKVLRGRFGERVNIFLMIF